MLCIKSGNDGEIIKALMRMVLRAVVAQALNVRLDEITDGSRLVEDLGMDREKCRELHSLIADIFDCLDINVSHASTIGELLEQVVHGEFARFAA